MRAPSSTPHLFHRIAERAEAEYGVLGGDDLTEVGASRHQVRRLRQNGYLRVVHRNVFAPGHAVLSHRGRWLAACKAIDGVLSHWSAAGLWGFWEMTSPVHVTSDGRPGAHDGIAAHRSKLSRLDRVVHQGIPVTTPPRTLIDLAGVTTPAQLVKAVERMPRIDLEALDRALRRTPGRHGVAPLKKMVLLRGPHLRSHLERLFLRDCCAGLPRPQANVRIAGKLVDFVWPDHRLVVETDGWASHRGRAQFAEDRRRDVALMRAGFVVARFTYDRVAVHPQEVHDDLRALIAAR